MQVFKWFEIFDYSLFNRNNQSMPLILYKDGRMYAFRPQLKTLLLQATPIPFLDLLFPLHERWYFYGIYMDSNILDDIRFPALCKASSNYSFVCFIKLANICSALVEVEFEALCVWSIVALGVPCKDMWIWKQKSFRKDKISSA